jgi:CheY-like chemotaxis protein
MVGNTTRPPARVLVVDPDAVARELLCQSLNCSGLDATGAANSTDALEAVSDTPPHAVLLAAGLPDGDGYDLCRLLRERPDTHRTPIIALVRAYWADIQRALDAGCDVALVNQRRPEYVLLELKRVLPSHFRARS